MPLALDEIAFVGMPIAVFPHALAVRCAIDHVTFVMIAAGPFDQALASGLAGEKLSGVGARAIDVNAAPLPYAVNEIAFISVPVGAFPFALAVRVSPWRLLGGLRVLHVLVKGFCRPRCEVGSTPWPPLLYQQR